MSNDAMNQLLLDDAAFHIEIDAQGVCRIARTNAGFDTTESCIRAHERVADAVAVLRGHSRAVFDVRLAPPRNDPEFEKIVLKMNARMFRPFERVAFLVRTAAGKLHVRRLTRDVSAKVEAFADESEALAWLQRS
jgi:hypothetical protein